MNGDDVVTSSDALAVLNEAVGGEVTLECRPNDRCDAEPLPEPTQAGLTVLGSIEAPAMIASLLKGATADRAYAADGDVLYSIDLNARRILAITALREAFSTAEDVSPDGEFVAMSGSEDSGIVNVVTGDQVRLLTDAGNIDIGGTALIAGKLYGAFRNVRKRGVKVAYVDGSGVRDIDLPNDDEPFKLVAMVGDASVLVFGIEGSYVVDTLTDFVVASGVRQGDFGWLLATSATSALVVQRDGIGRVDTTELNRPLSLRPVPGLYEASSVDVDSTGERLAFVRYRIVGCLESPDEGFEEAVQPEVVVVEIDSGETIARQLLETDLPITRIVNGYGIRWIKDDRELLVSGTRGLYFLEAPSN